MNIDILKKILHMDTVENCFWVDHYTWTIFNFVKNHIEQQKVHAVWDNNKSPIQCQSISEISILNYRYSHLLYILFY